MVVVLLYRTNLRIRVGDEIHPYVVEAMEEVGVDISDQYPKGLRTYLGKMGFNYLIIVCTRAEERCPKTFPGVGARFSWVFEDPRRDEEIPYDSMLERKVRDEIELKMKDWLEHPEQELKKLREQRERERRERLAVVRWEADEQAQRLEGLARTARSGTTSRCWPDDLTLARGQEPTSATSENAVMAEFAEFPFHALR